MRATAAPASGRRPGAVLRRRPARRRRAGGIVADDPGGGGEAGLERTTSAPCGRGGGRRPHARRVGPHRHPFGWSWWSRRRGRSPAAPPSRTSFSWSARTWSAHPDVGAPGRRSRRGGVGGRQPVGDDARCGEQLGRPGRQGWRRRVHRRWRSPRAPACVTRSSCPTRPDGRLPNDEVAHLGPSARPASAPHRGRFSRTTTGPARRVLRGRRESRRRGWRSLPRRATWSPDLPSPSMSSATAGRFDLHAARWSASGRDESGVDRRNATGPATPSRVRRGDAGAPVAPPVESCRR